MKIEHKIELILAIFAGSVAIFSAYMAYNAKSSVAMLRRGHEKELELIRSELAQSLEERKFSFEERRNGYRDFFDGTSKYWESLELKNQAVEAKNNGDESKATTLETQSQMLHNEYIRLLTSAKFKIGVFSDKAVVQAIANYFRRPEFNKGSCRNREKFLDDVAIYQAMRNEMKAPGKVLDSDLILVLFDCKLED